MSDKTKQKLVHARFLRLNTNRVVFQELPRVEPTADPAGSGPVPTAMSLTVTVGEFTEKETETPMTGVTLEVTIEPEPTRQPYHIEVALTGLFAAVEGTTAQALAIFAKNSAPGILWPYVRALISQVTSDARYGAVLLDPVNVSRMLARKEGWEPVEPNESRADAAKEPGERTEKTSK